MNMNCVICTLSKANLINMGNNEKPVLLCYDCLKLRLDAYKFLVESCQRTINELRDSIAGKQKMADDTFEQVACNVFDLTKDELHKNVSLNEFVQKKIAKLSQARRDAYEAYLLDLFAEAATLKEG